MDDSRKKRFGRKGVVKDLPKVPDRKRIERIYAAQFEKSSISPTKRVPRSKHVVTNAIPLLFFPP
jgi:hypothetical protein